MTSVVSRTLDKSFDIDTILWYLISNRTIDIAVKMSMFGINVNIMHAKYKSNKTKCLIVSIFDHC